MMELRAQSSGSARKVGATGRTLAHQLLINCFGGLVAGLMGVAITMGHNEPGWMQES